MRIDISQHTFVKTIEETSRSSILSEDSEAKISSLASDLLYVYNGSNGEHLRKLLEGFHSFKFAQYTLDQGTALEENSRSTLMKKLDTFARNAEFEINQIALNMFWARNEEFINSISMDRESLKKLLDGVDLMKDTSAIISQGEVLGANAKSRIIRNMEALSEKAVTSINQLALNIFCVRNEPPNRPSALDRYGLQQLQEELEIIRSTKEVVVGQSSTLGEVGCKFIMQRLDAREQRVTNKIVEARNRGSQPDVVVPMQ